MSEALEEHDGKASISGRNITNLRFADDIDALAEEELDFNELKEKFKSKQFNYFNAFSHTTFFSQERRIHENNHHGGLFVSSSLDKRKHLVIIRDNFCEHCIKHML